MNLFTVAVLAAVLAVQAVATFIPLFHGTLEGWSIQGTDDTGKFRVQDGVLHVEGPNGWLRSNNQ